MPISRNNAMEMALRASAGRGYSTQQLIDTAKAIRAYVNGTDEPVEKAKNEVTFEQANDSPVWLTAQEIHNAALEAFKRYRIPVEKGVNMFEVFRAFADAGVYGAQIERVNENLEKRGISFRNLPKKEG